MSMISDRKRLPTLFEVLNRRTQSPVDLWSFYVFMRKQYRGDYLDFWIDVVQHLSLCRHYVRGLRQSIMASDRDNSSSRTSSVLLDTLIQEGILDDADSHRLSAFLRGEETSNSQTVFRLSALLDAMNTKEQGVADLHSPPVRSENFINKVYSPAADPNQEKDTYHGQKRQSFPESPEPVVHHSARYSTTSYDDEKNFESLYPQTTNHSSAAGPSGFQRLPQQQPQIRSHHKYNSSTSSIHSTNSFYANAPATQGNPSSAVPPNPSNQQVALSAETIERLFPRRNNDLEDGSSFVTRGDIRQSSHRILVTYFIPGAEREIVLPPRIMRSVKHSIEVDGRDDPEVFDEAREYVFQAMERETFPAFLEARALSNTTPSGSLIRLIIALVALFGALWTSFSLIFMDYQPKSTRLWIILPFAVASYCGLSGLYYLDPLLALIGYSEISTAKLVRVREPFVRRLLVKRALFVLVLIIIVAAAFVVLFALVPGKAL